MHLLRTASVGFLIIFLLGCPPFRDSPFSDRLARSERDLNGSNLIRIANVESDGVVRIALFADSHGNYKDLDRAIKEINSTSGVDFVVNLGDFTNSGYNFEYDQFLAAYKNLAFPALSVIGNHDAIGAGSKLFGKAFGATNFYFESNNWRYIFWHSANLEDPKNFSPEWLEQTINASLKNVIIFSHVALWDGERFGNAYQTILDHANVQLAVSGHQHVFWLRETGTRLLQVPRTEKVQWVLLEIKADGFYITYNKSGETKKVVFK